MISFIFVNVQTRTEKEIELEAISLSKIIDTAVNNLKIHNLIDNVKVALTDNLPLVKSHLNLATAIENFIIWNQFFGEPADTSSIIVKLGDDRKVSVEIQLRYRSIVTQTVDLESPSSRLNVANLIIQQHGSQVEVSIDNQHIHFQFNLLPWEDDISH